MRTICLLCLTSLSFFLFSATAQTINSPLPLTGEQSAPPAAEDVVTGPGLNLIREYTPRYAYQDHLEVVTRPADSVILTTSYMDGLGRQAQTVQRHAAPGGDDLIQHVVYDAYGRTPTQYLPFADSSTVLRPGAFRHEALSQQQAFYLQANDGVANSSYPFAVQTFESNPLSRPLTAGAPGEAFQPGNGHTVNMQYRFNEAGEVKLYRYNATTGLPYQDGTYEASTLRVVRTTDENGHIVEEFTDLFGRSLLKAVQASGSEAGGDLEWAFTQYIYDDRGQLRAVFPPEMNEALLSNALTEALMDEWAFRYRYNGRGLMTAKRIPGKDDWDLIVYNLRDLPVLMQDPVQRATNEWSFTKYDHLNRPVMTGTIVLSETEAQIRSRTKQLVNKETGYEKPYPTNLFGYTGAGSWPVTYSDDVETVTWYDDYGYPCGEEVGANGSYYAYPTGQVTGTAIRHPYIEDEILYSATYYDEKMRPVEVVSMNALGGTDRTVMSYTWAGEVITQTEKHTGSESVTQTRAFTYDHAGRLLQTDHTVERDGGYHPVRWTESQNVTIYETLIFKSGSSTTFDAGALSVQRIPAGRDGSVFFKGDNAASMRRVIGLDDDGFDFVPLNATHALYLYYGDVNVIDNGTLYYDQETWTEGDELEVVRENGQVLYKKNGITFFTSSSPSQNELRAVCSFKLKSHYLEDVLVRIEKEPGTVETVTLAKNEYNALGELINKKVHSTDGQSWLQDTDYRYNIRGWLARINDPEAISLSEQGKAFGMQLSYHEGFSVPQYNGNISGMRWAVLGQQEQAYGYAYDPMNRLANAWYQAKGSTGNWNEDLSVYDVALTYDKNGNIETLDRNGILAGSQTTGAIDQLSYGYNGNRLRKVDDGSNAEEGFSDGANLLVEYTYDANGNMVSDENKGISSIAYNKLNLPTTITFSDGRKIVNRYTLDGIKRRSEYYQAGATEPEKVTDYAGSIQYEDGVLTRITTEEGRVAPDEDDAEAWRYYYNLTDHLGNVRATVTDPTATEYLATLEPENSEEEEATFTGLDAGQVDGSSKLNGQNSQWLRGYAADEVVGMAKSLAVYPGDQLSIEVQALFTGAGTENVDEALSFGAMFLRAFGIPTSGEGAMNPADFDGFALSPTSSPNGDLTKGYLNYLYFDKEMNFITAGFEGITEAASTSQTLSLSLTTDQEGFVFVYVTNEEPTAKDIYFDDLKITHTPTVVVQTDSYYPFGLSHGNMSYVREGRAKNQFLYNGKELVEGFDLGWYDYGARYYAPDLGRWHAVDPLAEKYVEFSPYNYVVNNPIMFIDPDGRNPAFFEFLGTIDGMMKSVGESIENVKDAIIEMGPKTDPNRDPPKEGPGIHIYDEDGAGPNEKYVPRPEEGSDVYYLSIDDLSAVSSVAKDFPRNIKDVAFGKGVQKWAEGIDKTKKAVDTFLKIPSSLETKNADDYPFDPGWYEHMPKNANSAGSDILDSNDSLIVRRAWDNDEMVKIDTFRVK